MPNRRTARLASWQKWLVCLSGGGLWMSGTAWLLLHYFGQREGEFGMVMNPAEPVMMQIHGFVLIPALMGVGAMFVAHIPKGWDQRSQRIAGIALSAVLAALICTGYLLYYAGGEALRQASSIIHWAVGLALPVVFAWHWIWGVSLRRSKGDGCGRTARMAR